MEPITHGHHASPLAIDGLWTSSPESRAVLDLVTDYFVLFDREWQYLYMNAPAAEALGAPEGERAGQPARSLFPPEPGSRLGDRLRQAMGAEEPSHFQERSEQDNRWYDFHCYPYAAGLALFFRDVTEQRLAEERLRTSDQRLRFTLESANVGTWDWDIASGEVEWSDNLESIHGRLPGSFSGSFESVMEDMVPEDREYVQQTIARALSERTEYLIQYRVIKHDGSIIWVEGKGRAQYDEDGRPVRMVGVCADITERKNAEAALSQREQELRSLNATLESRVEARTRELAATVRELETRNRELHHFAFAASHDLQEPLRKVATFCDLLRLEYGSRLDAEGTGYLDRMETAVRRMSVLLRDLLSYARITSRKGPFQEIDIKHALADALVDLEDQISASGARIEADELGRIHGDPIQIRQLLQNLIANAIKFHKGDPPVVKVSAAIEQATGAAGPEQVYVLRVKDNGVGIEKRHVDRIFAPFQRLHTREKFDGSGIGLAVCRRIAERHRGTIEVTSNPGEGSTFAVKLPVKPQPLPSSNQALA